MWSKIWGLTCVHAKYRQLTNWVSKQLIEVNKDWTISKSCIRETENLIIFLHYLVIVRIFVHCCKFHELTISNLCSILAIHLNIIIIPNLIPVRLERRQEIECESNWPTISIWTPPVDILLGTCKSNICGAIYSRGIEGHMPALRKKLDKKFACNHIYCPPS